MKWQPLESGSPSPCWPQQSGNLQLATGSRQCRQLATCSLSGPQATNQRTSVDNNTPRRIRRLDSFRVLYADVLHKQREREAEIAREPEREAMSEPVQEEEVIAHN